MIQAAFKRGQPLPERIQNAPSLDHELFPVLIAFWQLSTTRQMGSGSVGPIPWTAVNDWAIRHGLEDDVFDYLLSLIHGIDDTYLNHLNQKSKSGGS